MATFKFRRSTAAQWTADNTILAQGEPGYETDSKRWKIGTGSTPWNTLDYEDKYGRQRENHEGTQLSSTISDLLKYVQDRIGNDIIQGAGITIEYDDAGTGKTKISATGTGGTGGGLTSAQVRALILSTLIEGDGIDLIPNLAGDQLTVKNTGISTGGSVIKTYATEAAAQAGLAANEFGEGDLIVVGP